jgi:hypothetical protein
MTFTASSNRQKSWRFSVALRGQVLTSAALLLTPLSSRVLLKAP